MQKSADNYLEWIIIMSMILPWLAGIVLATGAWSTTFSITVPPYAWYLVVEKIMQVNGWL